jgi:hypothetical protein
MFDVKVRFGRSVLARRTESVAMRALRILASALFLCAPLSAIAIAATEAPAPVATPAAATAAKKPLLFFFASDNTIDLGDSYTEIENGKVLATARDRLVERLGKTFGTTIVFYQFKHFPPSGAEIAQACAQTGAVGAGVHGPGKENIGEVVLPAMEDAYARLSQDVADSPKSAANYERYGIYMNDDEADSFWLPTIAGKKTVVEVCEALGTASRAGLRIGDEVRSINGAPTIGIDFDALNAAMKRGVTGGTWTLDIVGKDNVPRMLTFQNQTTAWYAAHPLAPAAIPTRAPFGTQEKTVPFTYPRS